MTLPEALPTVLSCTPRAFMMPKSTCFPIPTHLTTLARARINSYGVKIPFRFATNTNSRFHLPPPPRLAAHFPSSSSSRVIIPNGDTRSDFKVSGPAEESHTVAEDLIEKAVYMCRFLATFGVLGSLFGSVLCFVKGSTVVAASFMEYCVNRGRVISMLVEALDVYLLGTVMLVFGMGLFELFISTLDIAQSQPSSKSLNRSNLFGMFTLVERPKWLQIKTVDELKTKVGHVIVMLLLIGLFDKSKKTVIQTPVDLLCFATSVLLSSGCLYLLSRLNGSS